MTRHHLRPRSRSGSDDNNNLTTLDGDWHMCFHDCFSNMTTEEIKLFLDIVMVSGKHWTRKRIKQLTEAIKKNDTTRIHRIIKEADYGDDPYD